MMDSLSSLILARLQYLQDMLARANDMTVCLYTSDGTDFTIPSNQQQCCFDPKVNNNEACKKFVQSAINQAKEEGDLVFLTCHRGLTTAVSPLGLYLPNKFISTPKYYLFSGRLSLKDEEKSEAAGMSRNTFENRVEIIKVIFDLIFSLSLIGELDFVSVETDKQESNAALTGREKEIIRLVSLGLSNQEIADQLFISDKTVKTHLSNIYKKLEMTNRTELALYAIQTLT
ncbi:MAG: LuxR family transcriptional regulator [Dethiobacteria bacterium]|jgi:DNA-binding CsgD family transcriptional regulator|nr:LuxR family transcriptional regulator [Bacillota bacterium]NMD32415.1 hypothetical protein [Bacillota bacterium]HOB28277.1 LuxR family transcriptional regulator [Bacillota bacterium]HPZ42229.1 LuxR family transcriptional regulator [Bacillota bacterium]HQD53042.1 LuxR family transcriptional regulator [Bacillota bacterium]